MSVLSEILAAKRTEVEWARERVSLRALQERLIDAPPVRDFRAALTLTRGVGFIAEVKKASPSKGVICPNFDHIAIARAFAANGANCLSVLTDEKYFQGRLDYLTDIREIVSTPILRKDFIVDPYQIAESRAAGADAVLLIVAALQKSLLRELIDKSRQYGMAAIVEAHDADEAREAIDAGADIIGVNNRDLHTFRTSISVTLDVLNDLPSYPGRMIVSESGIFTRSDVEKLQRAGVDAVLVGEALVSARDMGAKLRELTGAAVPTAVG